MVFGGCVCDDFVGGGIFVVFDCNWFGVVRC